MKMCQTCASFSALENQCRAHSPQPIVIPGPTGEPQIFGIFPSTAPTNWCAEWREEK